jgi:putative transposase
MREKNQIVPDEMLSKEFLSRFKTESDVSKFLKQLHAQVLEKMLEGEMDAPEAVACPGIGKDA